MNNIWRRLLKSLCLMLVALSVLATPALADPGNPPVWPPVSDIVVPVDDDTTAPPAAPAAPTANQ